MLEAFSAILWILFVIWFVIALIKVFVIMCMETWGDPLVWMRAAFWPIKFIKFLIAKETWKEL